MRPNRFTIVGAKNNADTMVRDYAVCRYLFKRRHLKPADFYTVDLFPRTAVAMGRMAILTNR